MEGFIGEVRIFAGNFAPRSWAFCEGQLMAISQNSALFSILGTTYGGDGRTTFGLPDLRGRVPVGEGNGPGLSDRRLGAKGGVYENTMTISTMPSHQHSVTGSFNPTPDTNNPSNAYVSGVSAADVSGASIEVGAFNNASDTTFATDSVVIGNTGGSQPFNNMQPWISIYYIIALFGTYPSRS